MLDVELVSKREDEAAAELADSRMLRLSSLVGVLKHLPRTGWVKRDVAAPESVAGHMYRMGVFALLLGGDDGADRDRCIRMALVHDLAECIVGDITPECGVSQADKHQRESEAMKKVCALMPETAGEEVFALWEEYEAGATAEARAVKDLDRFDMIAQAFEYERAEERPRALQEFFDSTVGTFTTRRVTQWVAELNAARDAAK